MARRHGRATMPWGKWKGTRIRNLPDDYLSWLTSLPMMYQDRWDWLLQSLVAELKFRGMNVVGMALPDVPVPEQKPKPRRGIALE